GVPEHARRVGAALFAARDRVVIAVAADRLNAFVPRRSQPTGRRLRFGLRVRRPRERRGEDGGEGCRQVHGRTIPHQTSSASLAAFLLEISAGGAYGCAKAACRARARAGDAVGGDGDAAVDSDRAAVAVDPDAGGFPASRLKGGPPRGLLG